MAYFALECVAAVHRKTQRRRSANPATLCAYLLTRALALRVLTRLAFQWVMNRQKVAVGFDQTPFN